MLNKSILENIEEYKEHRSLVDVSRTKVKMFENVTSTLKATFFGLSILNEIEMTHINKCCLSRICYSSGQAHKSGKKCSPSARAYSETSY